jgi:hypothetical protein
MLRLRQPCLQQNVARAKNDKKINVVHVVVFKLFYKKIIKIVDLFRQKIKTFGVESARLETNPFWDSTHRVKPTRRSL